MNSTRKTDRVISLALAFLVFVTSAGFSIDMHFCGNHLKSFSFMGKAKNCFELAKMGNCSKHKQSETAVPDCEMTKKDCCHNKTINLQADLTADVPVADGVMSMQLQTFIFSYVVAFYTDPLVDTATSTYKLYKPPLLLRDIPVLIQSFLL